MFVARAEDVDSHDNNESNGDTTITIKRGIPAPTTSETYHFEDHEDTVSGDPKYSRNEARESWKEKCQEWKKEIRETLNQEDHIFKLSCGKEMDDTSLPNAQHQFSSTAKYTVKTLIHKRTR